MARFLELSAYPGVMAASFFIDGQDAGRRDQFLKPLFILVLAPRVRDSEPVFAEDNDRQFDRCRAAKNAHSG